MIRAWSTSLEGRLVLRLSGLLLAIVVIGLAAGLVSSYRTAAVLSNHALAEQIVGEFLGKTAWLFPLIVAVVVAVTVWTVRSSLRPVVLASQQAAAISPEAIDVRLAGADLPAELRPLVHAVNHALDRLSQGFEVQRRFTADAAHELRTPLAILSAGLEALEATPQVRRLQQDAARMCRLVEQLLEVARLDACPTVMRHGLDLNGVAADVVEQLAPWAMAQQRELALEAADAAVWVMADADALGNAVRNLVENAVAHGPPGSEVTVSVASAGRLSVTDRGPGVSEDDELHIFERFRRGAHNRAVGAGAGLGLAIVAEFVRLHEGRVEVGRADGGGAVFSVFLPLAGPKTDILSGE
ncbi:MAG: hypothetical protein JWO33_311 [Caulobacteraceae bacterium]|nr:hypothetical protein [Caulobacteraceae bacterium]